MREIRLTAANIAAIYFFGGFIWVIASDMLMDQFATEPLLNYELSVAKGSLFVLVTAILLYLLLRAYNRQLLDKQHLLDDIQRQYRVFFENNPVPMWVYDMETLKFLLVNNAAQEIYGYSESEFLRMTLYDLRSQADYNRLQASIENDTNTRYTYSGVWQHLKKNSEAIYVEINSHPVVYKGRRAKMVLASDVTQRVKTEQEISLVMEELNNFVYRASHDLRGPLARLIGLSSLVLDEENNQQRREYDQLIHNTALLLDSILNRLLSVNTLKHYEPHPEPIRLRDLVDETIAVIKTANQTPVPIRNEVSPGLECNLDSSLLKLALENLLDNSVKYTQPTGSNAYVSITAVPTQRNIKILIKDNGIGISEKVRPKIFDIFFRGTELSKGSGLGLYITQKALKKLNGQVNLLNDTGSETVFEVKVPGAGEY